jgi:hypothetical protein
MGEVFTNCPATGPVAGPTPCPTTGRVRTAILVAMHGVFLTLGEPFLALWKKCRKICLKVVQNILHLIHRFVQIAFKDKGDCHLADLPMRGPPHGSLGVSIFLISETGGRQRVAVVVF